MLEPERLRDRHDRQGAVTRPATVLLQSSCSTVPEEFMESHDRKVSGLGKRAEFLEPEIALVTAGVETDDVLGFHRRPRTTFGTVNADVHANDDPNFVRDDFVEIIRGSGWPE